MESLEDNKQEFQPMDSLISEEPAPLSKEEKQKLKVEK
jgi:hypothetical protein